MERGGRGPASARPGTAAARCRDAPGIRNFTADLGMRYSASREQIRHVQEWQRSRSRWARPPWVSAQSSREYESPARNPDAQGRSMWTHCSECARAQRTRTLSRRAETPRYCLGFESLYDLIKEWICPRLSRPVRRPGRPELHGERICGGANEKLAAPSPSPTIANYQDCGPGIGTCRRWSNYEKRRSHRALSDDQAGDRSRGFIDTGFLSALAPGVHRKRFGTKGARRCWEEAAVENWIGTRAKFGNYRVRVESLHLTPLI